MAPVLRFFIVDAEKVHPILVVQAVGVVLVRVLNMVHMVECGAGLCQENFLLQDLKLRLWPAAVVCVFDYSVIDVPDLKRQLQIDVAIPVNLQGSLLRSVVDRVGIVLAGACGEAVDIKVGAPLGGAGAFAGIAHFELLDSLVVLNFKSELFVAGHLSDFGNENVDHVDVLIVLDVPDPLLENVG
jgi:hypothetical protein